MIVMKEYYPPSFFFDGDYLLITKAIDSNKIWLLKKLANKQDLTINLIDPKKGFNVLWYAFLYNKFDAIRVLIEMGVDPFEQSADDFGSVLPYMIGQEYCMKSMLDGGLSPNYKSYKDPKHLIIEITKEIFHEPNISAGVKMLVERGADINVLDKDNSTALYEASWLYKKIHVIIALYLIEQGAEINIYNNFYGQTVAHRIFDKIKEAEDDRESFTAEYIEDLYKIRDAMIARGVKWPPTPKEEALKKMKLHGDKKMPIHGYDDYRYYNELQAKMAHFVTAGKEHERLIDNINVNYHLFRHYRRDINSLLNKYYYQDVLIEHIKMQDLLDDNYRQDFFNFLHDIVNEEYEIIPPLLVTMLLVIKLEQNQDSDAFYLLDELAKNEHLTYLGLHKIKLYVLELFIKNDNRIFFIKCAHLHKAHHLIDFIMQMMCADLFTEFTFAAKKVQLTYETVKTYTNIDGKEDYDTVETPVPFSKGQIFVNNRYEEHQYVGYVNKSLGYPLDDYPCGEAQFTGVHKNKKVTDLILFIFINIGKYLIDDITSKLSKAELISYDRYIYSHLKDYVVRNYHVNTSTGYANLRAEPNNNADVLAMIPNNEYVCFISDDGDWIPNDNRDWIKHNPMIWLRDVNKWTVEKRELIFLENNSGWVKVHYQQGDNGIEGYIHSSQLEQR